MNTVRQVRRATDHLLRGPSPREGDDVPCGSLCRSEYIATSRATWASTLRALAVSNGPDLVPRTPFTRSAAAARRSTPSSCSTRYSISCARYLGSMIPSLTSANVSDPCCISILERAALSLSSADGPTSRTTTVTTSSARCAHCRRKVGESRHIDARLRCRRRGTRAPQRHHDERDACVGRSHVCSKGEDDASALLPDQPPADHVQIERKRGHAMFATAFVASRLWTSGVPEAAS